MKVTLNFSVPPKVAKQLRGLSPIPNSGTHKGIRSPSMFAVEAVEVGLLGARLVPDGELPWAKIREVLQDAIDRQAPRRGRS